MVSLLRSSLDGLESGGSPDIVTVTVSFGASASGTPTTGGGGGSDVCVDIAGVKFCRDWS